MPLGGEGSGGEEASVCGEWPAASEPCCAPDPASSKPNEGRQAVETCAVRSRLLFLLFPSSPTGRAAVGAAARGAGRGGGSGELQEEAKVVGGTVLLRIAIA